MEERFDLLNGLYAYATGSTDSGIHDVVREVELGQYLRGLSEVELRKFVAEYVVSHCLCDDAIAKGYGPEDAQAFLNWFYDDSRLLCGPVG